MDERVQFISRYLDGEKMVDLCREFGISRKTGYKFVSRYERLGPAGLEDQSRRPLHSPGKVSDEIERLIVRLKGMKPSWGPKKLKTRLEALHPGVSMPAASTIGEILERHGLVRQRRRKRFQQKLYPTGLTISQAPNDIWAVDFKGHFRLLNRSYCYPLTVSDLFSRYLVGCESLQNTRTEPARECFEALFDEYGLPERIRSDNGSPFSSVGIGGLSELSVWWMKLGIRPERIKPGHPEQNGSHERMHRTLKEETTRPPAHNHLQQQEKFDQFREVFNHERPHEAIAMKTPASLYSKSKRPFEEKQLDYPLHDVVRTVNSSGDFRLPGGRFFFLSKALRRQRIGLRDLGSGIWLVSFSQTDLGYLDTNACKLLPDNPLGGQDLED